MQVFRIIKPNLQSKQALLSFSKFVLLLLSVFFWGGCFEKKEPDIDAIIQKVIHFENENDFENAINLANKAISIDSSESMLFVLRGRIRIKQGAFVVAINDFKHALLLLNNNTSAHYHLGLAYSFSDSEQDAISSFTNAINSKKKGNFVFEDTNIDKLSFRNQTDVPLNVIKFHRGKSYFNLDMDSFSIEDFNYSSLYDYERDESFLYLGLLYLNSDSKKACMYLQKAAQLGNNEAKKHIAKFCQVAGNMLNSPQLPVVSFLL